MTQDSAASREHVATEASKAHGYSRAVITGGGRTVYLCGETGLEDAGGRSLKGDFEAQTREVFRRIDGTLRGLGGSVRDMTTMTVFITDPRNGDAFRSIRIATFGDTYPASALIVAAGFGHPDVLVEIQGIAVLP